MPLQLREEADKPAILLYFPISRWYYNCSDYLSDYPPFGCDRHSMPLSGDSLIFLLRRLNAEAGNL